MRAKLEHVGVGRAFHRVLDFEHQEGRSHAEANRVAQVSSRAPNSLVCLAQRATLPSSMSNSMAEKNEHGRQK